MTTNVAFEFRYENACYIKFLCSKMKIVDTQDYTLIINR